MTLSRPKRRESSSHKYIEGKNFRNLKNDFQDKKRAIPENTHYREKYHCTSDPPPPLFDWYRFDQTRKPVLYST